MTCDCCKLRESSAVLMVQTSKAIYNLCDTCFNFIVNNLSYIKGDHA